MVGDIGVVVYTEMAGRVAAVSDRPVLDLVRERLGPGVGPANLLTSFFINLLTGGGDRRGSYRGCGRERHPRRCPDVNAH